MTATIQDKTITVVIGAYGTDDDGDAPEFAYTKVDQKFVDLVEKLVQLCNEHQLNAAHYALAPQWGPGDIAEELRLQNAEIVATANGSFWFTDYPKYGNYHIESRAIDATALRDAFFSAADGETVFLTDNPAIRERFEDEMSEADAHESDESTAEAA